MEKLKVLVITNMYPDSCSQKGIFVKEQVQSISSTYGSKVDLEVFSSGNGKGGAKYFYGAFRLLWLLIKKKFDVVHVHFGLSWLLVIPSYPILKVRKTKVVTTFHGSDLLGESLITRFISVFGLRLTCKVIFVSSEMALRFRKHCRKEGYVVIPCGVDDAFFSEESGCNAESKNVLLFPSSPDRREKNYRRFFTLSSMIIRDNDWLKAEVLDGLSRKEVVILLKSTYAVLMTSLREGSPQLVKEALALGVPVLSTDVGDLREMKKFTTCLFICNEDSDFVSAFESIKTAYPLDGADLRKEFYKKYSNAEIAQKIYDIYVG